ncbi:hypothetical protein GUJ93_ZPchr0007g3406 [Zizania palustris]|uniref:Uncharacterized protein n=1 Tax=Zizania palustris TaxID=103762 RepID=A0A8J5SS03_ZIZPA|nr:hypothetical protein GUJ93_ZPchr0007g3406 [Zizania palustris]
MRKVGELVQTQSVAAHLLIGLVDVLQVVLEHLSNLFSFSSKLEVSPLPPGFPSIGVYTTPATAIMFLLLNV